MGKQIRSHPFQAVRGALSHRQHPDWGLTMEPPFAFLHRLRLSVRSGSRSAERRLYCSPIPTALRGRHCRDRQTKHRRVPRVALRSAATSAFIHPPPPAPRLPNASLKSEPGHRVGEAEGTAATPCCTTPSGGSDGAALGRAHHGLLQGPTGCSGGPLSR